MEPKKNFKQSLLG